MHFHILFKMLGLIQLLLGATMALSLPWAFGDFAHESRGFWAILGSMGVCFGLGGGLYWTNRKCREDLLRKEGIAIVGLGWIACGILGALPFWLSGALGPVDALFESISGFTTTGATVFAKIEGLPRSILFWRSFTHWLGGMGILVLFIAVLPYLGVGGKQMFKSEAPGLNTEGLKPRIQETALTLWKMYIFFTALETLLLLLSPRMDLFEALCQTFGTMATGGFSTRDKSIESFQSGYVEAVIIVFMAIAGTNFSLFFMVFRGRIGLAWRDTELRVYLGILAAATAFAAFELARRGGYSDWILAFRHSLFQVVSLMTTTGYGTADFDLWPQSVRALLVALMFVGGMASSTGGGMKVIRVMILAKSAAHSVRQAFSPRAVRALRIGGKVLPESLRFQVLSFFCIWIGVTACATLLMALILEEPMRRQFERADVLETAFSAVAATLNNIGPGLSQVGETQNYAFIPWTGKLVLCLCMILGRLELYAILALFIPSFWRSEGLRARTAGWQGFGKKIRDIFGSRSNAS